jgi:hypothetical protein
MPRGVKNADLRPRILASDVRALVDREEDPLTAIDAINSVAKARGVSVEALKAAYYRSVKAEEGGKGHGNRVMTSAQEAGLLAAAVGSARNGLPWGLKSLRLAATAVLDAPVARGVLRGFLKRHKKVLKSRKTKGLGSGRNDPVILDEFEVYVEAVAALRALVPFNVNLTVTADEVSLFAKADGGMAFCEVGGRANAGESRSIARTRTLTRPPAITSAAIHQRRRPPPRPAPPSSCREQADHARRVRDRLYNGVSRLPRRLHAAHVAAGRAGPRRAPSAGEPKRGQRLASPVHGLNFRLL